MGSLGTNSGNERMRSSVGSVQALVLFISALQWRWFGCRLFVSPFNERYGLFLETLFWVHLCMAFRCFSVRR